MQDTWKCWVVSKTLNRTLPNQGEKVEMLTSPTAHRKCNKKEKNKLLSSLLRQDEWQWEEGAGVDPYTAPAP